MLSVILHCDLDCFYAQVERERLKLPKDAAVAVIQWNYALAVSYPARKFGINRGSTAEDIRRLAGDSVIIVPVETIGNDQIIDDQQKETSAKRLSTTQATEKVSLARYRNASANVFDAINSVLSTLHNPILERASVDEAYIDVTAEVDKRMKSNPSVVLPTGTKVATDTILDNSRQIDSRLAHGAHIAAAIRQSVFEQCNYTMSAGISMNKMLAKLASSQNKPNLQTIVPMSAVSILLKDLPLRKLRGFGGKLGKDIETLGVETAGQATALTKQQLRTVLTREKDVEFAYRCIRGLDDSKVVMREMTKSILAAKNFRSEYSLDTLRSRWLPLLAGELVERMNFDTKINHRQPRTMTVSIRVRWASKKEMTSISRSTNMPPVAASGTEARIAAIIKAAMIVIHNALFKEKTFSFPINFIGLTATNFVEWASERENISNYFKTTEADKDDKNQQQTLQGNAEVKKDSEEEHKKRLQESADRELALKLHREESTKHTKRKQSSPSGVGDNKSIDKSSNSKKSENKKATGTMTMDMFFGSAKKKVKR